LHPACVVVSPLVNFASREVDVVKAAKRLGIPTLLAAASWDNLTNKGRIQIQPDRIAVWNEAMRREAVELHGAVPDRVHITGAPVFDRWFDAAPTVDRAAFCRRLGFDPARPIIVYLCSSFSIAGTERGITRHWLHTIAAHPALRDAQVLVRPHPMALNGWTKVVAGAGDDGVAHWHGAVLWPLRPTHPTTPATRAEFFDSLYHADAIVGLNTSAMIEAAILRKPVLTFLEHAKRESQTGNLHFRHLESGGFLSVASTLAEHAEQLAAALERPPSTADACDRFVADFVRPLGRARRAADELVRLILAELKLAFPDVVSGPVAPARSPRHGVR
jgi:hypothetical protein